MRILRILLASIFVILTIAAPAFAQEPRAEARARFSRGVELFDEGRFDAALAEFQRAYDIAPAAPVLYNIAQVHVALGHSVQAVDVFERYLREGGEAISAERRAEVESELDRQRARIARLTIEANVPGAIVSIDDVDVGTAPLPEPIRVSSGEHVVAVRAPGHEGVRRRVRVSGGASESLHLELLETTAPRAALRFVTDLPGVEVTIDDQPAGLTPFDATVPVAPGAHQVRARRAGYVALDRRVEVAAGAELRVDVALERDPAAQWSDLGTLELELPRAPFALSIDGARVDAASRVELPAGPHVVAIEVAGRRPWRERVDLTASESHRVRPELEWTPDAYEVHHRESDALFTAAGVLLGAGAALVGAGAGLYAWNQGEWAPVDAESAVVSGPCAVSITPQCEAALDTISDETLDEWLDRHNAERSPRIALDWTSAVALGLGSALVVAGVVLLVVTPSHGAVDRAASARIDLRLGPASIALSGMF